MQRVLTCACLGSVLLAGGCRRPTIDVPTRQPMDFSHKQHLAYFTSGAHRAEKIKMHLDLVSMDTAPPELAEGRCEECHDDLPDRKPCAGCHVQFLNAALRSQKEVRRCVACHRGAWGGSEALIPSAATCLACHEAGIREVSDSAGRLVLVRKDDPKGTRTTADVPWVRINTMPPSVYFSHTAHVRFAKMPCTACHQDMRTLASTPSVVRVFSMMDCLTCHKQAGAKTDCLSCHK